MNVQIGTTYKTYLEGGPAYGPCNVTILDIYYVQPPTELPTEQNMMNLSNNEYQLMLDEYLLMCDEYEFSKGEKQIVVNIRELKGKKRSFYNLPIPLNWIDTKEIVNNGYQSDLNTFKARQRLAGYQALSKGSHGPNELGLVENILKSKNVNTFLTQSTHNRHLAILKMKQNKIEIELKK